MTRITGFKECQRAIDRIVRAVDAATPIGVEEAAELIRAEAAELAPKRTGNLAAGIHSEVEAESRGVAERAIGPAADIDYAEDQEFGDENNAANPFMRPAVDAKGDQAMQRVVDRWGGAIQSGAR